MEGKQKRRKGHDFERQTANLMTQRHGIKFMRTPHSGSMENRTKGNEFKGDIFTETPSTYKDTVIECKARKTLNFTDIFTYKGQIWNWIAQLEKHRKWMLFIKIDHTGTYAISNIAPLLDRLSEPKDAEILINGKYSMIKIR